MYLLDTVVLSELRKSPQRRNARVVSWLANVRPDELFLSAVSVAEVERGIARQRRADATFAKAFGRLAERRIEQLWRESPASHYSGGSTVGAIVGTDRKQ
jgi:predicted nucleic acid-binding protein